jgi:hypothetical protein
MNTQARSVRVNADLPTHLDPKLVTSEHCYERRPNPTASPTEFAYRKLLFDTELSVAFGDAGCPSELPAKHPGYYR